MTFRLNAQQLFLTYPKCPLTPQQALDALSSTMRIDKYLICQEQHQDSSLHLHCYLKLQKKINLKDPNALDLPGPQDTYHGNYQGVRSAKGVIQYLKKDGNYLTNIDGVEKEDPYQKAIGLAKDGDLAGAMKTLEANGKTCRDLVLHGETIKRNLSMYKKQKLIVEHALQTFGFPHWNVKKTLILTGPTGTGKTAVAKALLPNALLVSHIDRVKDYDPSYHDGIIFDDMSFVHWPEETQIHLVDTSETRDLHARYAPATVPAGTPRIITNNKPGDCVVTARSPPIARRVIIYHVPVRGTYQKINYSGNAPWVT